MHRPGTTTNPGLFPKSLLPHTLSSTSCRTTVFRRCWGCWRIWTNFPKTRSCVTNETRETTVTIMVMHRVSLLTLGCMCILNSMCMLRNEFYEAAYYHGSWLLVMSSTSGFWVDFCSYLANNHYFQQDFFLDSFAVLLEIAWWSEEIYSGIGYPIIFWYFNILDCTERAR